jgi:hypothetical protein
MAGAGYRLFNTGDVLTAAQVNNYLQEQVIMVFADSTARTTALSGVVSEGMFSYLTNTNAFQYYNGAAWADVSNPGDITAVTAGTGLSGGGTSGGVTLSIDTATTADLTTAQTLTNKTLTAPVISSISNTGTVTLPTSTDTLVGRDTTDTLTNKTLTSPTINGAFTNSVNEIIARGFEEDVNVVASAATGTINFDVATASIWYYTTNATANHTLNFRYSSGASLSSKLAVGDAITLVWLNTNGATPYYPNVIQIDGNTVTPKVPATISAGNASAIDSYTFTIIKTAATPTYTVLETQTKFA